MYFVLQADRAKMFGELAKLSYDETNRRAREIEEVQIGQDREYYDVLYLHNIVSVDSKCFLIDQNSI